MTDLYTFTVGSETDGFQQIPPIDDVTLTLTAIEQAKSKDGVPYDPPALFFQLRVDDYDDEAEDQDGEPLGTEWIGYVIREKVNLPKPGTNPGPRSNLYKLAKRMLGRDIEEGENINLKALVGKTYKADIEWVARMEPDPNKQGAFREARDDQGKVRKKATILNTIKPVRERKAKPKPAPVRDDEDFDWDTDPQL